MRRNRNASLFESLERRQLLAAGFQIDLVFDASVNSTVRLLINQARDSWQEVITGDIPDVGSGAWGAAVDDIRITASVITMDGANGSVAQGRPTYIRNLNKYPIAGEIQIDTADINATLANNTLGAIIEHEIAHALGFGTTWDSIGGLTNGSTTDPQFVGTNALNQYRVLSGNPTAVGIPLENTGNSGTFGTHWRESTFNTELMTGYIDPVGNELSALTIGAFQDMGYVVDYGAADAYYIPGSLGSIAGKVWNDTDGSGTQNGSEVGQQSTTVYIDADNDGTYDAGEKNTQTTSTGTYNFTNLTPGTHRVRVLLSSGFTQTFPSSNAAQVITLGFADNRTNVNFGVRQQSTATASIRGNAWKDNDQDGVIDSGESSIHARVIYIDADNDGTLDTGEQQTQTDANGDYSLAGLAAGTYRVRQVLPSGWSQTFPSANAAQVVTLTNGQQSTGKNFGSFQGTVTLASIGGTVWKDTDHDGAIDSGETVIQSRVVYLDTDNDGTLDSGESQTTSNSSGNYSFSGLAAGTYRVRQVVPSGWTQSYPASNGAQVVTLTSGQNVTGKNFGSYQVVTTGGSIRGTVWKDVNNNAVIDSGETGLSGRTVFIDADNDKILDAGEATTLTDSAGAYAFTNLPAAIYYIRQILPSGWAQTYPSNNYPHKITLNTGVNITQRNFGTNSTQPTGTASIKGTVWTDTDHDGVWDSGETGISGRTVFLDADNDKVLDSGETTTTTNSSGLYTFSQLVSGTYYVRQVLPSGWTQSFPTSNASHQIVLTTGAAITGKNFGAYTSQTTGTGSIKGTVWNDLDHDAVWDSNEVGIANRTVYIDADNDKVFDNGEKTAITNSAGLYTFSQLAAGIYYIRQVLPSGWAQSYPSTNYSQKITLNTGVNISQRNFGTFSTTAITGLKGHVFQDENRDGVADASETGVANRTVFADLDNDGVLDSNEPRAISDSSGDWQIVGYSPNSAVNIRLVVPDHWTQTSPTYDAPIITNGNSVSTQHRFGVVSPVTNSRTHILPGEAWFDTSGNLIKAHAGSILNYGNAYYWYGENHPFTDPSLDVRHAVGFNVYRSTDLYNWTYLGSALNAAPTNSSSDIALGKVIERPRVVYNESTGKFVMWFHVDNENYDYARAGVAVSDSPAGPFNYQGSVRPLGYESRDITVYKDTDGSAYLAFSSRYNNVTNRAIRVVKLSDDYLTPMVQTSVLVDSMQREAPSIFKKDGRYYLLTSGCDWWNPTAARVHSATSLSGTWTSLGNPATGAMSNLTYHSQGTNVLQITGNAGESEFVFLADRWNADYLPKSRYLWLPVTWNGTTPRLHEPTVWNRSVFA